MAPKITDFVHASNYDQDEHGDSLQDVTGELINRTEKVNGWRSDDIYRFGLTLLEIITAKRLLQLCVDVDSDAEGFFTVERMARQIDPSLDGEPQTEIRRCIQQSSPHIAAVVSPRRVWWPAHRREVREVVAALVLADIEAVGGGVVARAMAQWDNLGRAATIAQLTGVDALGLISTILQAAQAVRHNRETCLELVQDLQMIEDLLKLLMEPEMMRQDEIKNVLNGLDRTLKEADSLVQSCRDCSLAYRVFMGWKQSDQFRRVKKKIAKHLRFYPMISHADITRRLEELGKTVQSSSSSQQDAEEVTSSASTSSRNPEARNRVGTPAQIETEPLEDETEPVEIELTQAGSESTTVEEHQLAGNNETNVSFVTKKWRFGLKFPLSRKQRSRIALNKGKVETPPFLCELTRPDFTFFHFAQLSSATNDFASECEIKGWEHYDFYKGRLANGVDIMIRREPFRNMEMLKNEVQTLAKLRHMNIVKLIGCCYERGELILVYEYMENGRLLSDAITGGMGERFLNWSERFKIIIGIGRGLLYLHECCGMYIIHGDLSPRSILLDSEMAPKITNFAHADNYDPDKHGGSVQNTIVYGWRSDMRGFGFTLLEIITTKCPSELYSDDDYDGPWSMERITQQIDPALDGEPRTEIMRCIQVALLCVRSNEDESLSMWDVLLMLSCGSAVIPAVPRPRGESTQSTQHPEASGSGMAHRDAGEPSESDVIEPRPTQLPPLPLSWAKRKIHGQQPAAPRPPFHLRQPAAGARNPQLTGGVRINTMKNARKNFLPHSHSQTCHVCISNFDTHILVTFAIEHTNNSQTQDTVHAPIHLIIH
uniref:Uncharacterized protein n=1 Tax=Avena sativa TaxID=4498 RepID=A0ACD5YWA5_AVESA